MRFYKHLYFCDDCKKQKRKIRHKLRWKKPMKDIFVITLSDHPDQQLQIFNSLHFLQPVYFDNQDQLIVAITKGYSNALVYVEEMVKKVYNETGNADIRAYILNKEQE